MAHPMSELFRNEPANHHSPQVLEMMELLEALV